MKRLELYVSNDGRLTLSVFESENAEYEKYVLRGSDAYKYIKKLENKKIINVIEDPKDIDETLIYKDYIVHLNEYEQLLNRRGLKIIIDGIKQYIENEKLKKIRGKKVKRNNKYSGKRIDAAGLTFLVLGTCALGIFKYKLNNTSNTNVIAFQKEEQKLQKELALSEEAYVEVDHDNVTTVTVAYEDRSNTTKAYKTQENYGYLINKYATMYGIDPALALAVATQERGTHSTVMDLGGATGLMQIQNSVWVGQPVTAYNFQTKQKESFVVTEDKLQNLEYNIKIGCMILQNSFQYMKYNTLAAIQCYNMGYGNMMKILRACALDNNKTVDQILSDIKDNDWLDYRTLVTQGDQQYIEHVISWMGEDVDIKNIKVDGTLVHMNVNNNLETKKIY